MLATLLTRAALLAFPKPLRDRIGRPLAQTLLADCRTPSGRLSASRLAAGTIDIVRAGLAERMAIRRRIGGPRRRGWIDLIGYDLRYAARRLNRSRGFTFVALLTLALGIGANTAIFQLLDAVRLRPLPVHRPGELAEIRIRNFAGARGDFSIWHAGATNGIWEQIRDRQQAFAGVFAWSGGGAGYGDGPNRQWLSTLLVSGSFFPLLGVQPAHGRLLTAADDARRCSAPGTVLSYEFWQKEFGGDPSVVGRTVTLSRHPYEIVGVAPRHFTGLEVGRRFDLAMPLCAERLPPGSRSRLDSGTDWFLIVMGRLKPGVDLAGASAHLAAISPTVFETSLPPEYPAENVADYRGFQLEALDGRTGISLLRDQYATALWFLQATAALVLLVGCANLANLMLARATSRERELAARIALGAGRSHVMRVLLAESLLLSVIGAVLGAWLAKGLSFALVKFLDGGADSLFLQMPIDWRVFGFVTLAAVTTCVLCGLAPAWRGASVAPADVLRGGTRGTTDAGPRVGLRQILVTTQVALSLLLLVGALLFARSLTNLVRQDLGFRPDGVTIAYVDMSPVGLPVERRREFRQHVLDTLEATPGVVAAAVTSVVPLSGGASDNEVWLDAVPSPVRAVSYFAEIDPNYFRTMAIPLLEGREFNRRDTAGAPPIAIVNEAFVRRFVPDGRAVGRRVWREARAGFPATLYDIVGVVKNAKYRTLREELAPTIYLPASQDPRPGTFAQMLIRTSLPPGAVEPALRQAFRTAGPAIVPTFGNFKSMIQRSLTQDQLLAALSGFFGLFAVILATVGVYGSMSFVVARRTRELGIRIALGARRDGILRLVMSEAGGLVLIGCAIGGVLAVVLSTYVRSLIYALEPHDPWTMAGAVLVLMTVGLLACLGPALRAARVDPVVAFRAE